MLLPREQSLRSTGKVVSKSPSTGIGDIIRRGSLKPGVRLHPACAELSQIAIEETISQALPSFSRSDITYSPFFLSLIPGVQPLTFASNMQQPVQYP